MPLLEQIAGLFYDPAIFWGAPLVLAVLYEICGRLARKRDGRP